jgi:hypothetical protein
MNGYFAEKTYRPRNEKKRLQDRDGAAASTARFEPKPTGCV